MGHKCLWIESLGQACLMILVQSPRAADGDGDVGNGSLVYHSQFLARCAIDIFRHVAVGELYPYRVVVCNAMYFSSHHDQYGQMILPTELVYDLALDAVNRYIEENMPYCSFLHIRLFDNGLRYGTIEVFFW